MEQKENTEKIQWHPAFCGGIELELKAYRDILEFEAEHYLSKEPIRMDMLIIKKRKDVVIDNPIGEIFRTHNVIEYKSPKDSLSMDEFYKTIGYACIYKGLGARTGEISEKELTVSIFRHVYPRKLLEDLKDSGAIIEKCGSGIYRVCGVINIPVQIVVNSQLEKGEHSALKILTENADEYEVRRFIAEAWKYDTPMDRHNADAVLQVSVSSNEELYEKLRKEQDMCSALRKLMREEIEELEAIAEAQGLEAGREEGREQRDREKISEMLKDGKTPQAIADFCKYPLKLIQEIELSMLVTQ